MCLFMCIHCSSGPAYLLTKVAWDGDSFQMSRFYVFLHLAALALFSTHFANISQVPPFASRVFLHQWPDFCVKLFQILWKVVFQCYGAIGYSIFIFYRIWFRCHNFSCSFLFFNSPINILWLQSLKLEFLCNGKERFQIILKHSCLPMVKKVNDGCHFFWLHPPHVDQRMSMAVPFEKAPEEWTWCCQN